MKSYKKNISTNHNKTKKSFKFNYKYTQKIIVLTFIQMLNTVKLYHWKTHSYAEHKATDTLYENLNVNIDKFVETMLGKHGNRVDLTNVKYIPLYDFSNEKSFKKLGKFSQDI